MCASSSMPVTSRGPGREKYADASTATTGRLRARELGGVGAGLLRGARRVVAAGHRDHDVGARPRSRPTRPCASARRPRPSTSWPPASSIISGTQCPPTNGGSSHSSASHARARCARDGGLDRLDAPARPRAQRRPRVRSPAASASRLDVGEHLAERHRVEREHARAPGQGRRDRHHVVVGDGAHLAHGLGHDQVRRELPEPLGGRARTAGRPRRPSRARCGRSRPRTARPA